MNDLRKMKLVKSRTNKMLTGVCGGIGELLGIDLGGIVTGRRYRNYPVYHCSSDHTGR